MTSEKNMIILTFFMKAMNTRYNVLISDHYLSFILDSVVMWAVAVLAWLRSVKRILLQSHLFYSEVQISDELANAKVVFLKAIIKNISGIIIKG
jgi:hypothetical protein